MLRSICLHGPESTGKSTIAPRLARHLGGVCIDEYGRTYCETFGTDLAMADLVAIARAHDAEAKAALAAQRYPVVLDTDPLMTTVWADMLFARRDPWFETWHDTADLYLLFDIDLPWEEDGTRMFGTATDRRRFFDLSQRELERRGVRWRMISGAGEARWLATLAAIDDLAQMPGTE